MKTPTTYATKSTLLDYVTKSEFGEFKIDMNDFRDEVHDFKAHTQKQFIKIDRRFDELKEEFRLQTGVLMDQMHEDRKLIIEHVQGLVP